MNEKSERPADEEPVILTDDEWRLRLTPSEYSVLRQKGTEPPFTGKHWKRFEPGVYECAACGSELFASDAKYDAGCGWPSFWRVTEGDRITLHDDYSHGMHRIEVTCARCGSHLGHLFDDGPQPTGQRYCINSVCIRFRKAADQQEPPEDPETANQPD